MFNAALTMQFVYHRFLDYHDPTIGENCVQWCNVLSISVF